MEFELDFLEPVGYIRAINTADEDFPTMCVVGRGIFGAVCGVKGYGFRADDCQAASVITNGSVRIYKIDSRLPNGR
jgi:hypothetical protein